MACYQLGLSKNLLMKNYHYKKFGQEIGINLNNVNLEDENGIIFPNKDEEFLMHINTAKAKGIDLKTQWNRNAKDLKWTSLKWLANEYKNYKKNSGLHDYTDMLVRFVKEGMPPKLDFLFIDEAQDLSQLQWQAVEKLSDTAKETYIAGDDDQAIFRWAGADVEHFINMKGKKKVLEKSHRVPKIIHSYAMKLIQRIKNRNIKKYLPRNHKGDLQFHRSSELNVEKNDWLILATTNYILDKVEENLIRDGIFFKRKNKSSIGKSTIGAIKNWENLRKGKKFTKKAIKKIYRLMKENVGVKEKHIELESMPNLNKFSMNDLIKNYGLLTKEPWGSALKKISLKNKTYLELAFRKGENISFPRVKISTIHGAKGTQCDNVVLFTDLSREADKQYYLNPDDQTRVMYVGVTRAKRSLHIVTPQTERGFLI